MAIHLDPVRDCKTVAKNSNLRSLLDEPTLDLPQLEEPLPYFSAYTQKTTEIADEKSMHFLITALRSNA
jgi:hypothetical protein